MEPYMKKGIRNILNIFRLKLENEFLRRENADLREQITELKANLNMLRDFEKARLNAAKKSFSGEVL